jgi:DNA polymerase-1
VLAVQPEGYRVIHITSAFKRVEGQPREVLIENGSQLLALEAELSAAPVFALDTETTGLDWTRSEVFMLSFALENQSWVAPSNRFPKEVLSKFLKIILRDPSKSVIGHNIKFDMHHVHQTFGVQVDRQLHDTLLMGYLMDENRANNLKRLVETVLGMKPLDEKQIHAWMTEHQGKRENWNFSKVPEAMMVPYAGADPWFTYQLYLKFLPDIEKHFKELYETERKVLKIMWKLEQNGVRVDVQRLELLCAQHAEKIRTCENKLYEINGGEFNIASPIELRKFFYEKLQEERKFKTKKGEDSTDEEALRAFRSPASQVLQVLRGSKNIWDYADGLVRKQVRGIVHGDYALTRTKTGRFSCSDPNLQNVPKDRDLRTAFIPCPGYDMFYFDHAQIEMVGFAHYSKDPKMMSALHAGQDLHALAAAEVYEIPVSQVTKEQRAVGKGTNFSIIYGVGKDTLASYISGYLESGKFTKAEALAFKEKYFQRFPSVPKFQREASNAVKTIRTPWKHYIRNQFGRVRRITNPFDTYTPEGKKIPGKAYTAVNHLIQGWAPDLMKRGMVLIEERLKPHWRQNVHDELRIDLPSGQTGDKRREMVQEIVRCLTYFPEVRVPVNCKVEWSCTNWAEVKKYGNPT